MEPMITPAAGPVEPNPPQTPTPADGPVVGYCRSCGKALTETTRRIYAGTLFCEEHALNVQEAASPYTAANPVAATGNASPALAWILGLIPGVGAIYNGQYAKGFVHALIFGLLVSILGSESAGGFEPLFALMTAAFVFYQSFEAYHTAKMRNQGLVVDEFSSLIRMRNGNPLAPALLIVVGVAFLLSNLGLFNIGQLLRFWPALLILAGVMMLIRNTRGDSTPINGQAVER
jgi:hypothetical protein